MECILTLLFHRHTWLQYLKKKAIYIIVLFFPQINLQRRMRVTGLITQGAKRIGSPEYVKSYKVAYSDDGKAWRTYKVKGKDDDMVRHTDTVLHIHCHPLLHTIKCTD